MGHALAAAVQHAYPRPAAANQMNPTPEQMAADTERRRRVELYARWLVQGRWVVALVSAVLTTISVWGVGWLPSEVGVLMLATEGGMVAVNAVVLLLLRRGVHRFLLEGQVFADLVAMNVLLHFSGGIENPLYILPLFYIIVAGILLPRRECFVAAGVASVLCLGVAWGEWAGVLEHYELEIVPQGARSVEHASLRLQYVASVTGVLVASLFLTAHFVTWLAARLRANEGQLSQMAARALVEHRRLEQALEMTATGLRVLGQDLSPRWANEQWREWFHQGTGSLPGRDACAEHTLRDGELRSEEIVLLDSETNRERIFKVTTAPIFDENGAVREVVELASEVTEAKDRQEQMMRASRLAVVGELASRVAHEVNNPITIMGGKARLLLSRFGEQLPQKVGSDLGKIVELTDRVAKIAQALLSYSRPSHGRRDPVDVRASLSSALDLIRPRCRDQGVEVQVALDEAVPLVSANSDELGQIFLNLLLNAADAMPAGGTLMVSASEAAASPGVEVRVADTGTGIPAAIAERIFEPFFTTKEAEGTGLGLSICYGLVKSHEGTIEMAQRKSGGGTVFTVWLPVAADAAAQRPKEDVRHG